MIHYYKVNCHADNLKLIREFVKVVLRDFILNETQINQMVLAVDEVCTNIICHSAENNPDKALEVNIIDTFDMLEFEIIDKHCAHFDPANYIRPCLQTIVKERRKGGIGLLLVGNIMDDVQVNHDNTQNTWRMRKSFAPLSLSRLAQVNFE